MTQLCFSASTDRNLSINIIHCVFSKYFPQFLSKGIKKKKVFLYVFASHESNQTATREITTLQTWIWRKGKKQTKEQEQVLNIFFEWINYNSIHIASNIIQFKYDRRESFYYIYKNIVVYVYCKITKCVHNVRSLQVLGDQPYCHSLSYLHHSNGSRWSLQRSDSMIGGYFSAGSLVL